MFTVEWLKGLIPETVPDRDAIITQIMAEKGKAITEALSKYGDYDTIKSSLTEAQKSLTDLQAASGDVKKLQDELDALKAKDKKRQEEEAEAATRRALEQRFVVAKGDAEFIDPVVESAVMAAFISAVTLPANQGKGDAAIYAELTKDKPYFKSQNPPGAGSDRMKAPGGVDDKSLTQEAFNKMNATDRTALKARNPELYAVLAGKKKG